MTQLSLSYPTLSPAIQSRIDDARRMNLSDAETAVLDALMGEGSFPRVGRDAAMQIRTMQAMWARRGMHVFPERAVKDAAKQLLELRGVPVGSSRASNCAGYFLVVDDGEAESTVRAWSAEIRSLAKRCRALSPKTAYVKSLLGQISAELEG